MAMQRDPLAGVFRSMDAQPFRLLMAMIDAFASVLVRRLAYGKQHTLLIG